MNKGPKSNNLNHVLCSLSKYLSLKNVSLIFVSFFFQFNAQGDYN